MTAIEEAQDLTALPLDDLLGKLITHEMILNEDDWEIPISTKNLALKSKKDEPKDASDSEDEDDPFALITRGLSRILKMKKQFNKDRSRSSKFQGN